jgi:lysophospholipase L1-like esterase
MNAGKRTRAPLSWRKRLVFAVVPVVSLGLAWEGVCRALPAPKAKTRQLSYLQADPDLLWRLTPLKDGPQATNSLGLRDTAYDSKADVKVLLLGDSIAYGDGEPVVKLCFPQLLEEILRRRDSTRSFEVINAGVPGYSTFQQTRYLELHGLELKPDAVVLQFCLNDVFERYTTVASYGGGQDFFGIDTRRSIGGLHGWLIRTSRGYERLASWRQAKAKSKALYTATELAKDTLSPELEEAWTQTLGDLERLRDVCKARGLPLLIAITPYAFQVDDPSGTRQPQDRLMAWSLEHGVPCLDMLGTFVEATSRGDGPLFFDENHFAPRGQVAATNALFGAVEVLVRDVGR